MPFGLGLLPDRLPGLIVLVAHERFVPDKIPVSVVPRFLLEIERRLPPLVDKIPGQSEIALLPRQPEEPDQGHFDNLMPGIAVQFALLRAENAVNQIRVPACHVQQAGVADSLREGDGGFDQMTRAV